MVVPYTTRATKLVARFKFSPLFKDLRSRVELPYVQGVIQAPHNASGKVSEINDLSELRFLEVINRVFHFNPFLLYAAQK